MLLNYLYGWRHFVWVGFILILSTVKLVCIFKGGKNRWNTSLLSPYLEDVFIFIFLKYYVVIMFNMSKTRCHHEDILAGGLQGVPLLWCSPVSYTMYSAKKDCWNPTHLQYAHKENKQAEMRYCLYGIFCLCGSRACVMWMWSGTYRARCLMEIRSVPPIVKIPVMNLS